jgi:hypothetical protein
MRLLLKDGKPVVIKAEDANIGDIIQLKPAKN